MYVQFLAPLTLNHLSKQWYPTSSQQGITTQNTATYMGNIPWMYLKLLRRVPCQSNH